MIKINPSILSKTVKAITPKTEKVEEAQIRGTIVFRNQEHFVQLDGAPDSALTPISDVAEGASDAGFVNGDRVLVLLKNHQAIVTKNLTVGLQAQAAKDAGAFVTTITDEGITAQRIIANDTFTNTLRANHIRADDIIAGMATIDTLDTNYAHITEGVIDNAKIGVADVNDLEANYAHITQGVIDNATIDQADVNNLDANYAHITQGVIDNATIDQANINNLAANYAKVNAANIDSAAIRNAWVDKIMVQTGLIASREDVFYLNAIQIDAANIVAGTIDVNRLIVTVGEGSSAQKYLINIDPSTGTPSYEKLDGNIVAPRTITADKIVAGAITTNEITANNLQGTSGWINLHEGKFFYGNGADFATATNAISWNGSKLQIKADEFLLSTGQTIQDSIESVENWFYSVPPTTSNPPASSWTTTNLKEQHLRDIYFDTTSGKSYRWAKEGSTYKWVEIEDVELSALAKDLHDNYPPYSEFTVQPDQIAIEVGKKVGTNEVIAKINASTEGVQILAEKVDIAGAAVFNNYSTTQQMNTAIGNAVDGIEVGGTNLLSINNWENGSWNPNTGAHATSQSRIRNTAGGNYISVIPNQEYIISRHASSTNIYHVVLYAYDDSGSFISSDSKVTWQTAFPFIWKPTTATRLEVGIRHSDDSGIDIEEAAIARIQIEKGNKATDYSLSDKDIADSISVGGRNLFRGSNKLGNETAKIHGWVNNAHGDPDIVIVDGEQCIHLQENCTGAYVPTIRAANRIPLEWGGVEYVISCDIRFDKEITPRDMTIPAHFHNGYTSTTDEFNMTNSNTGTGFTVKSLSPTVGTIIPANKWMHYEQHIITKDSGDGTWPTYRPFIYGAVRTVTENATVNMYLKNYKFEKGNKATTWSPAPEDVQAEIDAKKSIHTFKSAYLSIGTSYSNILGYSAEGTVTEFTLESTTDLSNVKIGDTIRLCYAVSDMNLAKVYIIGEATSINNSEHKITIKAHGLDTTVIDGGHILTGTIDANKVNIQNLTVGSAQSGWNGLMNSEIKVGGRNLLWDTEWRDPLHRWHEWGAPTTREIVNVNGARYLHLVTTNNAYQGYEQAEYYRNGAGEIKAGDKFIVSLTAYAQTAGQKVTVGIHWRNSAGSIIAQSWFDHNLTTTPARYTSPLWTVPDGAVAFNCMIGQGSAAVQELWISQPMVEKATQASDWSPAPEDVPIPIVKNVIGMESDGSATLKRNTTTILGWNGGGSLSFKVDSTNGLRIGDMARVQVFVSDMNNAPAYVMVEVTNVDSTTHFYGICKGVDTTVIDGGHILANSVTANQIAARTIGASKLLITDDTNLITATELDANSLQNEMGTIKIENGYLIKNTATQAEMGLTPRQISNFKQNDEIYFELRIKAAAAGNVRFGIWGYDASGAYISGSFVGYTIAATTSEQYISNYIKLTPAVWTDTVKKYVIGINDDKSTKSQLYVRKAVARRKNAGELIVDGSITTGKLDANAVTIGKLDETTRNNINHAYLHTAVYYFGNTNIGWRKIGHLKSSNARVTIITLETGAGYNGRAEQNTRLRITIKAGNGASTTQVFGVTVEREAGYDIRVKVIATATTSGAQECDVYWYCPWNYNDGNYTVTGYFQTWTNDTSAVSSEPTGNAQEIKYRLWTDNYITEIDSGGIFISPENQSPTTTSAGNSVKINASGMEVYKGGTSVAFYGDTARIGKSNSKRIELDSSNFAVIESNGIAQFSVDATSDSFTRTYTRYLDLTGGGFIAYARFVAPGIGSSIKVGAATAILNVKNAITTTLTLPTSMNATTTVTANGVTFAVTKEGKYVYELNASAASGTNYYAGFTYTTTYREALVSVNDSLVNTQQHLYVPVYTSVGTLDDCTITTWGRIAQIRLEVHKSSVSSGSNVFEGVLTDFLPINDALICGYYGGSSCPGKIEPDGSITVRNAGSSSVSPTASSPLIVLGTYIFDPTRTAW